MVYRIRQAIALDFSGINQLCVQAYKEYEPFIGSDNWQKMKGVLCRASDLSETGEMILAEEDNRLLGVVVYFPPGRSDGIMIPHEWASIRMLAVAPSHRGRGIGKKLTEECIDRACRDGAEKIGLTTGDLMAVALPMYLRMGFIKDAELESRLGVPHARYVLELKSLESLESLEL